MQLHPHDIHIWTIDLNSTTHPINTLFALLDNEEQARAQRLYSEQHQNRFIISHGILRKILSLYTLSDPILIKYSYNDHKKPFLPPKETNNIQFNMSHSQNLALVAVTLDHAIGIDAEAIRADINLDIANRYFSGHEIATLNNLSEQKRQLAFFRIWSRKEAIIKALGVGLAQSLTAFTVSEKDITESISIHNQLWTLTSLSVHPDYACAVATNQPIRTISYWPASDDKLITIY